MAGSNNNSIHIAVMGVTGAGKSTFIQQASGLQHVGVGHQLHSFTSDVEAFEFEHRGRRITLIDTPGFNDTTKSETEVLKAIADHLDYQFRNPPHVKLQGIIYLQSIMDPRMYGSSLRNLKMFKDLVGPDPLRNVVLTTTRWGTAAKSGELALAEQKEEQLGTDEDFWAPMIERGSRMARFEDTRESALELISSLIDRKPIPLQIQTELVTEQKALIDTAAGTAVNEEAKRIEQKYKQEIAQIQKEMDEALAARDHDVQEALAKSASDFQRKLDKVHAEQDMLRYERRNETRRLQHDIDTFRAGYEKELEKRLGEKPLDYDEVVRKLRTDIKLRDEQRVALEAQIAEMSKKPKKDRTVIKLLAGLLPMLGSLALTIASVVMGGGPISF